MLLSSNLDEMNLGVFIGGEISEKGYSKWTK
jgi:hypothetical protein